jgi:hypothetical protein
MTTNNYPTRLYYSRIDNGNAFTVNEDTGVMTIDLHHPFGQMLLNAIEDGRQSEMEVLMLCIGGFMADITKHGFPDLNGDIWCPQNVSERLRYALKYLDENDPAAEERRVNKEIEEYEHEANFRI